MTPDEASDAWTIIGTENGPVVLRAPKVLMKGEYITVFEKPPEPKKPREWNATVCCQSGRIVAGSKDLNHFTLPTLQQAYELVKVREVLE